MNCTMLVPASIAAFLLLKLTVCLLDSLAWAASAGITIPTVALLVSLFLEIGGCVLAFCIASSTMIISYSSGIVNVPGTRSCSNLLSAAARPDTIVGLGAALATGGAVSALGLLAREESGTGALLVVYLALPDSNSLSVVAVTSTLYGITPRACPVAIPF